jgi:hypothetical protein
MQSAVVQKEVLKRWESLVGQCWELAAIEGSKLPLSKLGPKMAWFWRMHMRVCAPGSAKERKIGNGVTPLYSIVVAKRNREGGGCAGG